MTGHRSRGVYRLLEGAHAYERFQRLLGAEHARRRFVDEVLQPFPGVRLLDVGCGAGTLLDYLPPDVAYTGFDMNEQYIAAARERYGNRGQFVQARIGASIEGVAVRAFDRIVARSVLHHLTDVGAESLLQFVRHALAPGGVFVTIDPVRHERQPLIARLLIALDRGAFVRTGDAYRALLDRHFAQVDARRVTDLLPIPYSHWIMRAMHPA